MNKYLKSVSVNGKTKEELEEERFGKGQACSMFKSKKGQDMFILDADKLEALTEIARQSTQGKVIFIVKSINYKDGDFRVINFFEASDNVTNEEKTEATKEADKVLASK
jgi:hypothetical protein